MESGGEKVVAMLGNSSLTGMTAMTAEVVGDGWAMHTRVVIIAAFFVVFTLCLSSYLLFQHLSTYNVPEEQRWLIGIIFMVPVYTVSSFISLSEPAISIECTILGNCYEAFAMYSFGRYLIACLGTQLTNFREEDMAIQKLERQASVGPQRPLLGKHIGKHLVQHPVPLNWCVEPWQLGREFYDTVKFGIVQYMILKTTCSWVALVLERFDAYGDGDFVWSKGYPYITLILNFSQLWALYCLVQFYHATKKELHAINPLAKFLCFKAVVFVTWWQGVIIAFIFSSGLAFRWFSKKAIFRGHVQSGLQDLIICVEMAIAAVAHIFVYPATPYERNQFKEQNTNLIGIMADDVEEDIEAAATSLKESVQDVVFGGAGHVVEDVKITMSQAVEPLESRIIKINETFQETIHSWGGKQKEIVTKEDTYLVKADSGAAEDTGVVKTKETVEVIRNDVHGDGEPEAKVTTTSQISYTPGADGTESDSSLEKSDRKSVLRTERSILVRSNSQVRTRGSRQQVKRS